MRGSPLLRALLAFLAILALGYPLRRLTGESAPPAPAPPAEAPKAAAAAESEVTLQVTFTTPPRGFTVRHLGREIWKGAEARAETTLKLPFPREGIELQFAAEFPEGSPLAAVRLVLTDPAGDPHEKSCWGQGQIDEVVAFP